MYTSRLCKILSVFLKSVVIVCATIGILLSAGAGHGSFMGGSRVLMFFTIQSNIAIALICLIDLVFVLPSREIPVFWAVVKYIGTVSITLTGVVFVFVLAPTLGAYAWNVQNILTHVVVPVAAVIDFFLTCSRNRITKWNVFLVTIPPLLYAIYAGIGYLLKWEFTKGANYPYFFLNWGSPAGAFRLMKTFPFMGTAWWIFAILMFLLAVGYAYLKLLDTLQTKEQPK